MRESEFLHDISYRMSRFVRLDAVEKVLLVGCRQWQGPWAGRSRCGGKRPLIAMRRSSKGRSEQNKVKEAYVEIS
jgi:hypothetical protein